MKRIIAFLLCMAFACWCGLASAQITNKKHTHALRDHVGGIKTDQDIILTQTGNLTAVTCTIENDAGSISCTGASATLSMSNIFATDVFAINYHATGSYYASGTYYGNGSGLTDLPAAATPTLSSVLTAGNTAVATMALSINSATDLSSFTQNGGGKAMYVNSAGSGPAVHIVKSGGDSSLYIQHSNANEAVYVSSGAGDGGYFSSTGGHGLVGTTYDSTGAKAAIRAVVASGVKPAYLFSGYHQDSTSQGNLFYIQSVNPRDSYALRDTFTMTNSGQIFTGNGVVVNATDTFFASSATPTAGVTLMTTSIGGGDGPFITMKAKPWDGSVAVSDSMGTLSWQSTSTLETGNINLVWDDVTTGLDSSMHFRILDNGVLTELMTLSTAGVVFPSGIPAAPANTLTQVLAAGNTVANNIIAVTNTAGTLRAGSFINTNAANSDYALFSAATGTGSAIYGEALGAGVGVSGHSHGAGAAVYGSSVGTGPAIYGFANGGADSIYGYNTSGGTAIMGYAEGNSGSPNAVEGYIGSGASTGYAIYGHTVGATSIAGKFKIEDAGNSAYIISGETIGTGGLIYLKSATATITIDNVGVIDVAGYEVAGVPGITCSAIDVAQAATLTFTKGILTNCVGAGCTCP